MRKNFALLLVCLIACPALVVACGGETTEPGTETTTESTAATVPPPTKEEAAEIIQKAPEYSDFHFTSVTVSIPMKEEMMHDQMKSYVRDLERAGWLRLDSTGTVVLSDKARRDNRWVERPNGFTDVAPLARKEFGEVTSIEPVDADTVKVDFNYTWQQNESGAAIQSGLLRETLDSVQYATATLENYGSGWELYIIRRDDTPPATETTAESDTSF